MTRFSLKYIEFIRSSEAQILQEGHEISIGEHRVLTPRFKDDRPWVVTRGSGIGLTVEGVHADGTAIGCLYAQERSRWLPTLSDLLDMIQATGFSSGRAGRALEIIAPTVDDPEWYVGDEEGERFEVDKDRMLAAAKLAVRVLEREHGRNTS